MRKYDPIPSSSPRVDTSSTSGHSFTDLYVKTAEITNMVDVELSRQSQKTTPEGIQTSDIVKGAGDDFVPLQSEHRVDLASNRPTEEIVAEQLAKQNVHTLDQDFSWSGWSSSSIKHFYSNRPHVSFTVSFSYGIWSKSAFSGSLSGKFPSFLQTLWAKYFQCEKLYVIVFLLTKISPDSRKLWFFVTYF